MTARPLCRLTIVRALEDEHLLIVLVSLTRHIRIAFQCRQRPGPACTTLAEIVTPCNYTNFFVASVYIDAIDSIISCSRRRRSYMCNLDQDMKILLKIIKTIRL